MTEWTDYDEEMQRLGQLITKEREGGVEDGLQGGAEQSAEQSAAKDEL